MINGIKEALNSARRSRQSNRTALDSSLDLGIESLEQRKMLAGDVSVNVSGDNLIIKGDNADNEIYVYENGGNVWVDGLNGTTLSKDATSNSFDTGISATGLNKLKVKLKGGDDTLEVYDVTVNKTNINLGKGDDSLDVDGITSGAKFVAKTGQGDDLVLLDDDVFNGKAKLNTGSGADEVYVAVNGDVDYNGRTVAKLGSGDDYLRVNTAGLLGSTSERISLDGGSGAGDELDSGNVFTSVEDAAALGIRVRKFELFS